MRATFSFRSVLTNFAALCLAASAAPADAVDEGSNSPVMVVFCDGGTLSGDLDPASGGELLWLSHTRNSITVRRPLDWAAIARIRVKGADIPVDELRRTVAGIAASLPHEASRGIMLVGSATPSEAIATTMSAPLSPPLPARHLHLDVNAAGWSDTVDQDGLAVRIAPVDSRGRLVPVSGTLEVEMIGRRLGNPFGPQPFFQLGRWTQIVRPDDFGPSGAVYQLPFQSVRPEYDLTVAAHGAVHASLGVPGQGTMDATCSTVRIRPLSPVRDDNQRSTGARFFPVERTQFGRPVGFGHFTGQ